MKSYTQDDTQAILISKLSSIETLYTEGFINRKGKTSDSKEYYTEILASELSEN
ncbi:hypothetical protein JEZ13_05520 [bacterium]|nr:hypothetical protein [bacterium]